ncbi:MAG: DUF2806 domain-containing protein, partial [Clostridia bacterium]
CSLVNIKDVAGFSKPTEKLIECISKGLGKSFNFLFSKKMADANVYEISALKEVLGDSESEITINRNGTTITLKNQPEKAALNCMIDRESKRLENTSKIIQNTADILEDKESISAEPVDEDWLTRFFSIAQDITNEEMQNLWSKILADEIEKPNSYSLRTLEVLKTLSSNEAKLFTKFVNLCFKFPNEKKLRALNDREFLIKYGIQLEDMMLLEELNLVNSGLSYKINPSNKIKLIYCDKLIFIESKKETLFWLYSLSTIGQEISSIIDQKFEPSYAAKLSECFKSKGDVSTFITDIDMNDFTYNPSNIIEI